MTPVPPALAHAARNPALTPAALRVLIRLVETHNDADFKKVPTWFVANQLSIDDATVRRGLLNLEQCGYIERGERDGNDFTFRLTPISVCTRPPNGSPQAAA